MVALENQGGSEDIELPRLQQDSGINASQAFALPEIPPIFERVSRLRSHRLRFSTSLTTPLL